MKAWYILIPTALLLLACEDPDQAPRTEVTGGDALETESVDVTCESGSTAAQPYPACPYGVAKGDVMANHHFQDAHTGATVSLSDFVGQGKLLLVTAAAGWCSNCIEETQALRPMYEQLHPQGLELAYVLFEDYNFNPPGQAFGVGWCTQYSTPSCLLDLDFQEGGLAQYFDPSTAPLNLLVRTSDMTILYKNVGQDDTLQQRITTYLQQIQ
jgi:hypothetical protein